jgi:hypothetical protein
MNLTFTKKRIAIYSLAIGFIIQIPTTILIHLRALEEDLLTTWGFTLLGSLIRTIFLAILIFFFWTYTRWVAATAEKAGRSYLGFVLIAISFTPIAWIIVLLFKKPETPSVSH